MSRPPESEDWRRRLPPLSDAFLSAYQLERPLGEGGMGAVYQASQIGLRRDVAIKLLKGFSQSDVARFEREGKVLAGLRHPGVLSVFDAGVDGNVPYLVCELVQGETLKAHFEHERLTLSKALLIAHRVAEGLAYAHSLSIVHRGE